MSSNETNNTEEAMPAKQPSTTHHVGWRAALAALVTAVAMLLAPTVASADLLGTFDAAVRDADGNDFSQAGAHPYDVVTDMNFFQNDGSGNPVPPGQSAGRNATPDENVRTIQVDLPPGLLGNPEAVPQCERDRLILDQLVCPADTQVGVLTLRMSGGQQDFAVYNMVPPPGQPAQFATKPIVPVVYLNPSVRPDGHLRVTIPNVSQALGLTGTALTMWGVPADHVSEPAKPRNAFMTNPTSCTGATATTIKANSWQDPSFTTMESVDENGTTGCEKLPFDPRFDVQTGSSTSDSPTGLAVDVTMPQEDANNPDGLVQSHLRDAVVTLPEGTTINPAAADGLAACSPEQFGLANTDPVDCPKAAKIGTTEIESPLQADPLQGAIYQADPEDNPFGELIAIYIEASGAGVQVKLAGEVRRDPDTGQITTVIEDAPQLPFSAFSLRFFSGPRAAIATPQTCGVKQASASFSPWSGAAAVDATSSFTIDQAPGNLDCADTRADRPFDPDLVAGLINPLAGSSSPFILRASRADGNQEIAAIDATLPEGISGVLASVELCSDEDAEVGACGAESRVGSVSSKVGAGPHPYTVSGGEAYLAGPYKGAPLSLAMRIPARAGIFDLGEVLVRAQIQVDKRDAHLRVISDPIPQILEGIPLRIRQVQVKMDREGFITSPTSCKPDQVRSAIEGASGATSEPSYRFQMAGCSDLAFSPKLNLQYKGKGSKKRNSHPRLAANLKIPQSESNFDSDTSNDTTRQANLDKVRVVLPRGTFLDQDALSRVCTPTQWEASDCPEDSKIGNAKAWSPILDEPLQGPVYLKVGPNELPDIAADLNGIVDIDLLGKIDQSQGRIRNTFQVVPDVPVERFRMNLKGGDGGLLVNSKDICKGKKALRRANVTMKGQNGATVKGKQDVVRCGGKRAR